MAGVVEEGKVSSSSEEEESLSSASVDDKEDPDRIDIKTLNTLSELCKIKYKKQQLPVNHVVSGVHDGEC